MNLPAPALCVALLACLAWPGGSTAQGPSPTHAVVHIPSCGGSGVVVATAPGRTLIVACAHMFPGGRVGPGGIVILAPCPPGRAEPRRVGPRLIGYSREDDLALILLPAGPLPYVARVAPSSHRPRAECLSVGYDEGRRPPQVRPARIVADRGRELLTGERPWHGRSGGALFERESGLLVGIVSGYEGGRGPRGPRGPLGADPLFDRWESAPGSRGIYISFRAVNRLLAPHLGGF